MQILMCVCVLYISEMKEYCHWDTFKAKCGRDEVVMIDKALYGRMVYGRCIERDYGYVGCSKVNVKTLPETRILMRKK